MWEWLELGLDIQESEGEDTKSDDDKPNQCYKNRARILICIDPLEIWYLNLQNRRGE